MCASFEATLASALCYLQHPPFEVIRSLFFNKAAKAIVTVSVHRADNFSTLRCRSTPLEYIRRRKPDAGFPVFEGECLKWPGFVEFDDVNQKVLTYSSETKAYRVWGLTNYELLYTVPTRTCARSRSRPASCPHPYAAGRYLLSQALIDAAPSSAVQPPAAPLEEGGRHRAARREAKPTPDRAQVRHAPPCPRSVKPNPNLTRWTSSSSSTRSCW